LSSNERPRGGASRGRGRDRELEAGTAAHYEDPAYYTQAYVKRTADVLFHVELAQELGGPVLEYGAGNGRITLPMARLGLDVTAVDLSAPMLADLRARLRREPTEVASRVTVRRGDMRKLRLGQRFSVVLCPFNTFLHLYERTDVEAFLARVHEHLAPGGELVIDVSIPSAEELARDPDRLHRTVPFRHSSGKVVRYGERFDYDPLRQVLFVAMEFEPTDGSESWMTPLAHRQFFPRELEALLHYNGFRIAESYGDFDRSPPTTESATLLLRCKTRQARQTQPAKR
jgi:SAM-dependent methyltransferase